jgi:alpha-mannosidase
MIGRWAFAYSLVPHEGGWETAFAEAHRFARPLRALRGEGGEGRLPPSGSPLEIGPDALVLSAFKMSEGGDATVVRVYNTSDAPQEGSLSLTLPHHGAELVDLNEEAPGAAEEEDGRLRLSARPNQIISVKFATAQEGAHGDRPR